MRARSVNISGTFGERSGNIWGAFGEQSRSIQEAFREHSGNIHLGNISDRLGKQSGNIERTPAEGRHRVVVVVAAARQAPPPPPL
jgi:hypothetical protein